MILHLPQITSMIRMSLPTVTPRRTTIATSHRTAIDISFLHNDHGIFSFTPEASMG